jgi:hypothetical protein
MKNDRLEPCYYGRRQVIYVTVSTVDRQKCKNLSIYGESFEHVLKAIDGGLTQNFGKTGSPRPKGRPRRAK